MTFLALGLILLSAVLHAVWNLLVKKASSAPHFILLGTLLVSLLWGPVAMCFHGDEVSTLGLPQWGVLLASALINLVYLRTLMRGYAASDLSVVYPVARGSAPLLVTVAAVVVLGERLSLMSALGGLTIVVGVFLIAGGPRLWKGSGAADRKNTAARGIAWGMGVGTCVASYTVVDAYAITVLHVPPLLVMYFACVLRLPFLLPFALRDVEGLTRSLRSHWRAGLAFAMLAPLTYVLVLNAVKLAPLSQVAPAREVSMLFAALLGGRLLGEADSALRLVGAGCIATGVVVLAMA
ncbi:DMT family transporter [Caldimonas brevitalea]|uniref:Integral membrane protein n=1 Tax=Caldimonas brevitalea TaxID=413882 RepID=A0A0G3BKX3_9BURK|nr:DMT family transporter [Caldimonas brevitalea]AKJ27190.1 integral membrane protein [Caldimonas brevitalea]